MIRGTEAMDQQVVQVGLSRKAKLGIALGGGVILAAALLWPSLRRWQRSETSVELARLRLATVVRGDLERDIAAQGRIVAAHHPELYSPAQGIVSLAVRAGQQVRAGQLLARVASPELASELAQERSRLASLGSDLGRARIAAQQQNLFNEQDAELRRVRLAAARRDLDRADRLATEGLLNEVDHDRASVAVRLAEVELKQAEEKAAMERQSLAFDLEDRTQQEMRQRLAVAELERRVAALEVVAPFAGLVATLECQDRDAVAANRALLTIVDLSQLEVEAHIPESYAADVAPGTRVVIGYDGRDYEGRLATVSPEVTASEVQGRVVFSGDLPPGLRQNQVVSIRLILERRRNVLKVVRGPFLESGGGRLVYVLADDLATRREIQVGASSLTEVEVVRGLAAGERILLSDVQQFNGARAVLVRR